ncbi:hypothetical protein OS493_032928 [Desmophyllum pertusum]|uniref:Uncharacterized protein n=1 Tax=Desmophyllum pertusum TaxID=174260 RepID=A0A9W9YKN6_9CNID|nr:hypothetical protein OS493_032928 [Desmophyllum pertusum]
MNLHFQAFECRLCEVGPLPSAHCPEVVYSLTRNVLRLDLYDTSTEEDIHINQVLIDEGFALFQEESRASKMNHQNAPSTDRSPADDNTAWIDSLVENDIEVSRDDPVIKVTLRGPESPIEMNFSSMTNIGRLKSVRVEQLSVNSVILNDQPQDPHQRFWSRPTLASMPLDRQWLQEIQL